MERIRVAITGLNSQPARSSPKAGSCDRVIAAIAAGVVAPPVVASIFG